MILHKNYKHNKKLSKYCDLVLSLYLDFFISSWKLACEMNLNDEEIMLVLKEERNPIKFYNKLNNEL
jgi:hypothetical protein